MTGMAASAAPLPSLSSAPKTLPNTTQPIAAPLQAAGGPFLRDATGRVVFLHGVNVVYKHPPYVVFPDPGKPWNFGIADASLMARLGLNVVRLGIIWKGLEPGTAPLNDPAICAPGRPRDPHQYDQAVFDQYLSRVKETVDLLGHYGIFTVLDMHQDVYNESFDGEGAPNWAVCTGNAPNIDAPGRWSNYYASAAAGTAFDHFWDNDVVGDLQGQYDMVWGKVAKYFASDPWVIGFDPFNEPFSTTLVRLGDEHFDAQLQCFYTGKAVGSRLRGTPTLTCPPQDPAAGVIPTLLANDPHALIFDEPDNHASRGAPTFLGPMSIPNLVYNVHIYCGARSPRTGNPTNLARCIAHEARAFRRRAEDRPEMSSRYQPGGPPWFVSEFGATSNVPLVASVTGAADRHLVGWTYWSWRYYADPTGSAAESVVMADGRVRSTARVLSRVYAEAVAGIPRSMSYDPRTARFILSYRARGRTRGQTVIVVPTGILYPHGYCARALGARVVSDAGSPLLRLRNTRTSVQLTVTPGTCPHRVPASPTSGRR
jgi:endoglycosylceramidase